MKIHFKVTPLKSTKKNRYMAKLAERVLAQIDIQLKVDTRGRIHLATTNLKRNIKISKELVFYTCNRVVKKRK